MFEALRREELEHLAELLRAVEESDPATGRIADNETNWRYRDRLIFEAMSLATAMGFDTGVDTDYGGPFVFIELSKDLRAAFDVGAWHGTVADYDCDEVICAYAELQQCLMHRARG